MRPSLLRAIAIAACVVIAASACSRGSPLSDFCAEASALQRIDAALEDVNPADRGAVLNALDDVNGQWERVIDTAPGDIAEDVALLAEFTEALQDAVESTDQRDTFAYASALTRAQEDAGDLDGRQALRPHRHPARGGGAPELHRRPEGPPAPPRAARAEQLEAGTSPAPARTRSHRLTRTRLSLVKKARRWPPNPRAAGSDSALRSVGRLCVL